METEETQVQLLSVTQATRQLAGFNLPRSRPTIVRGFADLGTLYWHILAHRTSIIRFMRFFEVHFQGLEISANFMLILQMYPLIE